MTEQVPNSNKKKIIMNAVDLGTLVLSVGFTAAASYVGPVATGVSVAVVAMPFMCSFSGVVNRRFPLSGRVLDEDIAWAHQTGLQRTRQGLKNIFNDARRGNFSRAAAMVALMGGMGLFATYAASHVHDLNARQEAFEKLPVLPANAEIRTEELCAFKRNIPFNTSFTHNGAKYRIECP